MATWSNKRIGMGIMTSGSRALGWLDTNDPWTYGGKTTYVESVLQQIDDIGSAVSEANDYVSTVHKAEAVPEIVQFWKARGIGTEYKHRLPHGDLAVGLRKRGVTPMLAWMPCNESKDDWTASQCGSAWCYQGAEHDDTITSSHGPFGDPGQSFTLRDWDSTASDRNWCQKVLDGDFDTHLDQMAADAIAWKSEFPAGLSSDDENDKERAYSDYDDIIIRMAFESNVEGMPCYLPEDDGQNGTAEDAVKEFFAAWAYIVDYIREEEGADNVHFLYCPANAMIAPDNPDAYKAHRTLVRRATTALPSAQGDWYWFDQRLVAGDLVQFLGFDHYDRDADLIDDKTEWMLAGTPAAYDNTDKAYATHSAGAVQSYHHIFNHWGGADLPMVIGEYGIAYGYGTPGCAEWVKMAYDGNPTGTTQNDNGRGRILNESKIEIADRCENGPNENMYRALRGVMYMATDRAKKFVPRLFEDESGAWVITDPDHSGGDGSGSDEANPIPVDNMDGDGEGWAGPPDPWNLWEDEDSPLDVFPKGANISTKRIDNVGDRADRGTLAEGAAGTFVATQNAFHKWCKFHPHKADGSSVYKFRGRGGCTFWGP